MTPRALARFQSFPDWYELPERASLACRIIGNAVPPLLMQRVMEAQKKLFGEE
jgi:DNA (cytosine-5)-methyltransferase 1